MNEVISRPSRAKRNRLCWILLIGAVLIAGAVARITFWHWRPVGEGPAGPVVSRDAFRQEWTTQEVLLFGIGDSVTAGLGAKSADHSYFNRLVRNPPDEFSEMQGLCLSTVIPNLRAQNSAISGSTSLQHLEVLKDRLQPQDESTLGIVVMTTGGNDLIHNYGRSAPKEGAMYGATLEQAKPWIEQFRDRLDTMLDLIDERFPRGSHVFLADIYDPTDGVGDAPSVFLPHWPDGLAIHAEYNKIIHAAADERENVHLVPLYETFLGHGSHCRQFWRNTYRADDPHYWYYHNIEDPNDRGYDAIRRIFLKEIARVVPGPDATMF
ncbi:MAG TPA: SGNH/GDSL hydrolase family protein [Pirellulaceae bacterium]|nr:SGNH/GDSL hydrolase family protein [Pirellulaceae bacterium]